MLRAMFSGRMEVLTDAEGWILIDRCGKHFGSILNFLRDEDVPLPDRSGSSHVFTIPESTNLQFFFTNFSLFTFLPGTIFGLTSNYGKKC